MEERRSRPSRRTLAGAALLLVLTVALGPPLFVPYLDPWNEVNCVHHDINIVTGKQRTTRMFWYLPVSEKIEGTPLSRALAETEPAPSDAWRRAWTDCHSQGHSPHYAYHSALHQVKVFDQLSRELEYGPARRARLARAIVHTWQRDGGDGGVDIILRQLFDEWSE